tara:strand:- start:251 stop:922 length:672 start_codon:yes stop_codon:yes gene_type:complete
MSYGVEIRNSSGNIVFDTESQFFSAISLNSSTTSEGITPNFHTIFFQWPDGSSSERPTTTMYIHRIPVVVDGNRIIHFINIPVGSYLFAVGTYSGNQAYYSDQSQLDVVYAQQTKAFPAPTATHGLVCYDGDGEVCYNPSHPMVHIQGSINATSIDSDWYSLQMVRQATFYGGWRFGNPVGVKRINSTTIQKLLYGYRGENGADSRMSYPTFGIHADIDTSIF